MDDELRTYLRDMEERLEKRAGAMEERLDKKASAMEERLDKKASAMEQRLDKKASAMEERLDQKAAAMEERLEERIENRLDESFTRWSQLILSEMGARFSEVNNRLESIDKRLQLQAGLIQSGARAMARFSEFAEKSEERWVDLTIRVSKIENKLDRK